MPDCEAHAHRLGERQSLMSVERAARVVTARNTGQASPTLPRTQTTRTRTTPPRAPRPDTAVKNACGGWRVTVPALPVMLRCSANAQPEGHSHPSFHQ